MAPMGKNVQVENEVKFVLSTAPDLEARICAIPGMRRQEILQGYLDRRSRVRRIRERAEDGSQTETFFFTHKVKIDGEKKELEVQITAEDFSDYWKKVDSTVRKTRYKIAIEPVIWDIDFLRDAHGQTIFAVAEAEMPRGMVKPEEIPAFLKSDVVFEVPRDLKGFGNRALAEERYARALWCETSRQHAIRSRPFDGKADHVKATRVKAPRSKTPVVVFEDGHLPSKTIINLYRYRDNVGAEPHKSGNRADPGPFEPFF